MIPLATHLRHNCYGSFTLTDAIRPGEDVPICPRQGYRIERFRDPVSRQRLPMLAASVSAEQLFEVFLELLMPIGPVVDAVLETSHDSSGDYHQDLRREEIDLSVLASHFCDFEDLLINDGCMGVAVLSGRRPIEVQLDEHKLLFVYAHDLKPFRRILERYEVRRCDGMPVIAESEHIHYSACHHSDGFQQLAYRMGAEPERYSATIKDFERDEGL